MLQIWFNRPIPLFNCPSRRAVNRSSIPYDESDRTGAYARYLAENLTASCRSGSCDIRHGADYAGNGGNSTSESRANNGPVSD